MIFKGHIFNDDGYPSEEYLQWLEKWTSEECSISELFDVIEKSWWCAEWGFTRGKDEEGRFTFHLSTGGWSGNESIISVLESNMHFWHVYWYRHTVGGHYIFKINL